MTVLSSIPNGASNKDIRDTLNALIADVAALKAGSGVTPTPTPTPSSTPGAVTIDPLVNRSGNVLTFTARRTTNLSNAESRTITVAGSTDYPPAALASDFGGSFPSATAAFLAGAATAPFTITAPAAVQPE